MAVDWVMRASSDELPKEVDPMVSSLKFRDFSAGGSSLLRDQNGMLIGFDLDVLLVGVGVIGCHAVQFG